MTKTKKFLLFAYLFVLFHTVKDFFQDFLETDFPRPALALLRRVDVAHGSK